MMDDRARVSQVSLDMADSVAGELAEESVSRPVPFSWELRRRAWHIVARQITLLLVVGLWIVRGVGRRQRAARGEPCEVMLTGRFDSNNWILAFLYPLSQSGACTRVSMISTNPVPALPHVVAIYPPRWLVRAAGATPARLLTFLWAAMRRRPHVVGGFHIMANGIAAVLVARLIGARSLYLCVGGPAEVRDGGIHSADSLFAKMETADPVVESRLLRVVAEADTVITMGTKAVGFFRDKGIGTRIHVVPGSVDSTRFQPTADTPSVDIILTGRLVAVKRIDILLQAMKHVVQRLPNVRAVIVGDGKLRRPLQQMAVALGVSHHVSFAGYVGDQDVTAWLRRSRVFVLTSDSEGLSLSMMEAMMCGLPVVVSDVGDLGDLVEDGVNGYLVPRRSPELFADRLVELLSNKQKLESFSRAARRAAMRYEMQATVERWDRILADL